MKSRRIPSVLAAAAVCCGNGVESASVRGVKKRRHADSSRPQHEHERQQRRTSLLEQAQAENPNRRDGNQQQGIQNNNNGNNDPAYWWHENESDEKDIVYQTLGVGSNVNANKLQQMHASNGAPVNAMDEGDVAFAPESNMQMNNGVVGGGSSNGFSVYSISVNNEPDTSHLAYRQPTRTPTPKPTKFPTMDPTPQPTTTGSTTPIDDDGSMVHQNSAAQPFANGGSQTMYYYPLWNSSFKGCASSTNPPEVYVNTQTYDVRSGIQYLFEQKEECCASWFGGLAAEACRGNEFEMEQYSESFEEEENDGEEGEGDDMEEMNGGSGGSATVGSNDQDPNPRPNPPPAPSPSTPGPSTLSNPQPNPEPAVLEIVPPPPTPSSPPTPPTAPSFAGITPTTPTPPTPRPTLNTSVPLLPNNPPGPTPPGPTPPGPTTPETAEPTPFDGSTPRPSGQGQDIQNDSTTGTNNNDDPSGNTPPDWLATPSPTDRSTLFPITPSPTPSSFFEVTTRPTPSVPMTLSPTTFWPSISPVMPPAFESFQQGDNDGSMQANSAPAFRLDEWTSPGEATALIYEQSFESIIPVANPNEEYIAWSISGNGQWYTTSISLGEGYDDVTNDHGDSHVATVGGSGTYAMESILTLTIGGSAPYTNGDAEKANLLQNGAFVSFGIWAQVAFPLDSLVFRVDDKIMGYWTGPNGGWERVTAYLNPDDVVEGGGGAHTLTWTYSYFGSEDADMEREGAVKLDGVVIEALTGDLTLSDYHLDDLKNDDSAIPALDLHHSSGDANWEVSEDDGAYDATPGGLPYVLSANTRKIIRQINSESGSISTYYGSAIMSFTIITGPFGGVLHYAIYSQVHTPIDVLEVGLDGEPVLAATSESAEWEEHTLEIPQGKHVVTFSHISNPAHLPMSSLEVLGSPGSSKVDGVRYVDHIDPALLTPSPTTSPPVEPTGAPTPYSIPPQNYCAVNLASVASTCYTDDVPQTCNPQDDPCPPGVPCWGNVQCDIPVGFMSQWVDDESPEPTPSPAEGRVKVLSPQNYCGPNLGTIRSKCYTDEIHTCNDDDGACPSGTFCWGNIACEVPADYEPPTTEGTTADLPEPTYPPPRNYCGTSLEMIRAQCSIGTLSTCNDGDGACPDGTSCWGNIECDPQNYCGTSRRSIESSCASGEIPTCNDDDGACPTGTYCWGNIQCDAPEEEEEATDTPSDVMEGPSPSTTTPDGNDSEEETVEGFLSSFFSSNGGSSSGSSSNNVVQDDEEEEEEEKEDALQEMAASSSTCPDDLTAVQGLLGCCVPDPTFLGDGACDAYSPYNTPECGYDLGDCCPESCNTETPFGCGAKEGDAYGPFGYYCLDPRYSSIDEEECAAENREWVGDGGCDPEYNTAACGWDGGDCCRKTCDTEFAYYECGRDVQPFDCKNPDIIYRADYVP